MGEKCKNCNHDLSTTRMIKRDFVHKKNFSVDCRKTNSRALSRFCGCDNPEPFGHFDDGDGKE